MEGDEDIVHEEVTVVFDAAERKNAFLELFGSGEAGFKLARERGLKGELRYSPIRTICWRVYLGVLPSYDDIDTSEEALQAVSTGEDVITVAWKKHINKLRGEYAVLKEKHTIDPHATEGPDDLNTHNPLSLEEDSPWQVFFQNQELQKEINQDIIRTYPDKAFFQKQETRDLLLRILFVYAKEHPIVVYKQGMHELLAPIVYLLEREKVVKAEATDDAVSFLNDEEFIEHDAFAIFSKLMETMEQYFIYTSGASRPGEDESSMSPIVVKCKKLQHVLLKQKDPQVFHHLEELNIEPQLYAIRWVRLLFGREFHLEDVLTLWDALFAFGNGLALVDYICIAMIQYIRSQILEMDYNSCLRRLFKYPPVEDVTLFIEKAVGMARPSKNMSLTAGAVSVVAPDEERQRPSVKAAIKMMLEDPVDKSVAQLKDEVQLLRETQMHMGFRLERIVYILQDTLLRAPQTGPDADMETTLMAIAELKQVKDILAGLLPPDTVPIIQPSHD